MTKDLFVFVFSFFILAVAGFYVHQFLLEDLAASSPIALQHLYAFFGFFSLCLCVLLYVLSKTQKFRDQIGFLYLVSVAVKIAFFCFVFYDAIFNTKSFTNKESINLLIPMFLMIILEVILLRRILNNLPPIKNAS